MCVSRFYAGGSWNEGTSKVPLSVQSRFMLACHFSTCALCVSTPPVCAYRCVYAAATTHVHGYTRVQNRVGPPLPSNWPWYIVPPDIGSYKFHRGFQRGCNRTNRANRDRRGPCFTTDVWIHYYHIKLASSFSGFHLTFINCTLEFFQLEKYGNMWNNDGKIFCGNLSIVG